MGDLLIYGASGFTGRLLAEEACRVGLRPILAGRTAGKLAAMAGPAGLPHRAFGLDDPRAIERAIEGVSVVLNAAGPFLATAGPLAAACIRRAVHYLDITGEVTVIEALAERDRDARSTGSMIMPAVGFDVVPSDCLAVHVSRRVERPTSLHIGISGLELVSRGSARTVITTIDKPVLARRAGRLEKFLPASIERSFDFGRGPSKSLAVTWGDVASAFFSTGVGDVTSYFEATPAVRFHNTVSRIWGWAVPYTPWQPFLNAMAGFIPDGPSPRMRAVRRAVVVVEAETDGRVMARSRLSTPEAYTFTAVTSIGVARRVLDGDVQPGFQTAARVYGPDLVLGFPGVQREDLS
jgi:short subunit dehydrogenase-like uncharacterized protein